MDTILENDRDSYPFTCNICGLKIKLKASFERHVRIKHDDGLYKCQNCEVKCLTRNELNIHIKKTYLKRHKESKFCSNLKLPKQLKGEKKSNFEKFNCQLCTESFSKSWQLPRHIKKQHPQETFKCSMCEYDFKEMHRLKRHMEIEHLEFKHSCHMCGKQYLYKCGLRRHIRSIHKKVK